MGKQRQKQTEINEEGTMTGRTAYVPGIADRTRGRPIPSSPHTQKLLSRNFPSCALIFGLAASRIILSMACLPMIHFLGF
jgi:hypothetical protein